MPHGATVNFSKTSCKSGCTPKEKINKTIKHAARGFSKICENSKPYY
jgi:hypothetical protein